jgi:hypothetical protein
MRVTATDSITLAKKRGEATLLVAKRVKGMERKAATSRAMAWKLIHMKRFVRGKDMLNVGRWNYTHSR